MIVTRFAPSPTGFLHLGHAFAALTAFEAARRADGRFLVRIEDIDRTRCRPQFEAAILEDLAWLGLEWKQPVRRQSEHFDEYAAALAALDAEGLLYPCFCTRKDIADEITRADLAPHGPEGPLYPGICRNLAPDIRKRRVAEGVPHALRLNVAKARAVVQGALTFQEYGSGPSGETGEQVVKPELLGDIVLARKELPASYHLAVAVDDALQGVTLVTRGHDLFHATHIQRLLQKILGLPEPRYAHHRLILDAQGRKFSKRETSVTLASLRAAGASPADIRRSAGFGDA